MVDVKKKKLKNRQKKKTTTSPGDRQTKDNARKHVPRAMSEGGDTEGSQWKQARFQGAAGAGPAGLAQPGPRGRGGWGWGRGGREEVGFGSRGALGTTRTDTRPGSGHGIRDEGWWGQQPSHRIRQTNLSVSLWPYTARRLGVVYVGRVGKGGKGLAKATPGDTGRRGQKRDKAGTGVTVVERRWA